MELELEPREVEFRERLEEWLAAVTRPDGLRDFGATPTLEDVPPGRQWQALLLKAGFAGALLACALRAGGDDGRARDLRRDDGRR